MIRERIARAAPDNIAQIEISHILLRRKEEGKMKINILELMEETKFPPEQIRRVMLGLKNKGVKEETDG